MLDGRYQIIRCLSQGAFGQIFLARDTKRPKAPICVVKQLKLNNSQPENLGKAKELFDREAETLELLGEHPQIPRLLAHFEIDGEFYLVEEYIEGKTLAEEFLEQQTQSEQQVIDLVSELLEILAFVHQNNIIHRDLKPSNIIRRQQDSKLVLIDFGAVKEITTLSNQATIIYTPGYAPPEQCHGKPNICSDIYAVGIIGIEALTGIKPNISAKKDEYKIPLQERASISREFTDILTKMVQENIGDRYRNTVKLLEDIKNIQKVKETYLIPAPNKLIGVKKPKTLLLFVLGIIATIPFFLWLKTIVIKPSRTNLPLNGKAITSDLNDNNICQDIILEQDIYCQEYNFFGEQDREITIDMNSNEFDPFLVLRKPDGNKLDMNGDRSVQNWNARIQVKLPNNGKYTVIARTTSPGESGKYTIRATIE